MNTFNSESSLYSASDGRNASAPSGYSPSVPISVYRELATELKTTQTTLDALTQQNQQLLRQNKLLRTEIHRFVQAAEQLGHFAGVMPKETPKQSPVAPPNPDQETPFSSEVFTRSAKPETVSPSAKQRSKSAVPQSQELPIRSASPAQAELSSSSSPRENQRLTAQNSAIVPHPKAKKRDRAASSPPEIDQHRLFTEQPEGMHPFSKVSSKRDLGNLWLATTILIVVVSAFGAGFLIMRPLLNR